MISDFLLIHQIKPNKSIGLSELTSFFREFAHSDIKSVQTDLKFLYDSKRSLTLNIIRIQIVRRVPNRVKFRRRGRLLVHFIVDRAERHKIRAIWHFKVASQT